MTILNKKIKGFALLALYFCLASSFQLLAMKRTHKQSLAPSATRRRLPQQPQQPLAVQPPLAAATSLFHLDNDTKTNIWQRLPFDSCYALAGSCKELRNLIIGNPDNLPILAAKKLKDDYVDPIARVLSMANGKPQVTLYKKTLPTALVINQLLQEGEDIIRVTGTADSQSNPIKVWLDLSIPEGVHFTQEQLLMCKSCQYIQLRPPLGLDYFKFLQGLSHEYERNMPIKATLTNQTINTEYIEQLCKYPIFSIHFNCCQFPDGLKQISQLTQLRELIITDRSNLEPNDTLFPPELCTLPQLKALKIYGFDKSIIVPAEIGNMHNLAILNLTIQPCSNYQACIQIPLEINNLKNSLKVLNIEGPYAFHTHGGSFILDLNPKILNICMLRHVNLQNKDNIYSIKCMDPGTDSGNVVSLPQLHNFELNSPNKRFIMSDVMLSPRLENITLNISSISWKHLGQLINVPRIRKLIINNPKEPYSLEHIRHLIQLRNKITFNSKKNPQNMHTYDFYKKIIEDVLTLLPTIKTSPVQDYLKRHTELNKALNICQNAWNFLNLLHNYLFGPSGKPIGIINSASFNILMSTGKLIQEVSGALEIVAQHETHIQELLTIERAEDIKKYCDYSIIQKALGLPITLPQGPNYDAFVDFEKTYGNITQLIATVLIHSNASSTRKDLYTHLCNGIFMIDKEVVCKLYSRLGFSEAATPEKLSSHSQRIINRFISATKGLQSSR